jgi:hypothetical protein
MGSFHNAYTPSSILELGFVPHLDLDRLHLLLRVNLHRPTHLDCLREPNAGAIFLKTTFFASSCKALLLPFFKIFSMDYSTSRL